LIISNIRIVQFDKNRKTSAKLAEVFLFKIVFNMKENLT